MNLKTLRKKYGSEFLRFILVGGFNTLITYLIYIAATIYASYQVAYAIAYLAGIFLSYWLNLRFVFSGKFLWSKFVRYPLIYLFQYGLGAMMLGFFVEHMGLSANLAPFLVIISTLPIVFVLNRLILSNAK